MYGAASVILTVAGLVGLGYFLRAVLPNSATISLDWHAQVYYLPLNMLAFWLCVVGAIVAGVVQTVRAILRDVERLR